MADAIIVSGQFPLPRILQYHESKPPVLVAQGAEGRLYKTTYLMPSLPCALKYRPSKPWRHPILDAKLTRQRIMAEARILAKCRREGVPVPTLYAVDEVAGWLMMEWIEGGPARAKINEWLRRTQPGGTAENVETQLPTSVLKPSESDQALIALMHKIGTAVARLHQIGLVHGDLTTSNMMLRPPPFAATKALVHATQLDGEIVIIDFGLATQTSSDEDRAVDLYVLERAFGSTHPGAEALFDQVLDAYQRAFPKSKPILRKLEDVRMRGRKRSMVG